MTIRTSLYPMGYRQTGSPQPTGDTPGNLLGLSYCYENYDDSDIETITSGNRSVEVIKVEIKEDVFRYNIDLSNYSGNADTVYIEPVISDIIEELDNGDGIAFEIWIKNRSDKDSGIGIYPPHKPQTRIFQAIVESYEIPFRKDTTTINECMLYKLYDDNWYVTNMKTLEIL